MRLGVGNLARQNDLTLLPIVSKEPQSTTGGALREIDLLAGDRPVPS